MEEVVVESFIPSQVRWIGLDRSVVCVMFRNLKFLFRYIAFDVGKILHHKCPFSFLPQSFLTAVAKQTLNGTISSIVAIAAAAGRRGLAIAWVLGSPISAWRFL